jgi:hypothetical protein
MASTSFHAALQKGNGAALKKVNAALRMDEDNVEKVNGENTDVQDRWVANNARGGVLEQKRLTTEAKRDEIQALTEEMDILILECSTLTNANEITEKRKEIHRKAAKPDKKMEEVSHM